MVDESEGRRVCDKSRVLHSFAAQRLGQPLLPHLCLSQCHDLSKLSTKVTSSRKPALILLFLPAPAPIPPLLSQV